MKKAKKIVAVALAAASMSLAFAGCGGSAESSKADNSATDGKVYNCLLYTSIAVRKSQRFYVNDFKERKVAFGFCYDNLHSRADIQTAYKRFG